MTWKLRIKLINANIKYNITKQLFCIKLYFFMLFRPKLFEVVVGHLNKYMTGDSGISVSNSKTGNILLPNTKLYISHHRYGIIQYIIFEYKVYNIYSLFWYKRFNKIGMKYTSDPDKLNTETTTQTTEKIESLTRCSKSFINAITLPAFSYHVACKPNIDPNEFDYSSIRGKYFISRGNDNIDQVSFEYEEDAVLFNIMMN